MKNGINKILKAIPIFSPDNKWKFFYDIWINLIIVFFIILIPYQVCVKKVLFNEFTMFTAISLVSLIIDLLVNLNTLQYIKGEPVKSRNKIFQY